MSLPELINAVEARRVAFEQEIRNLREERQRYATEAKRLEAARERNATDIAGYLLPDLDTEDLLALEQRIAYPVLLGEKRRVEAELATYEAERLRIEADPMFTQREVTRIELDQQQAEIADAARDFGHERALWEESKHFLALRERGWFEPDYDGGLFDWLRDWRSCSLLMAHLEERMPGRTFPDDDDVKEAWRKHKADADPVLELYRDIDRRREALVALEAHHKALSDKPAWLYQELYRKLGDLVVLHLRESPQALRLRLARGDETLANFLKKDEGLKQQALYLRELAVVRIDSAIQQLEAENRKLGTKLDKLRYKRMRGKYVANTERDARAMRALPHDKWQARRDGHGRMRERIVVFDRYDRGSFVSDFLWWDLMTRGARGDDLYEVRNFHASHPGWSVASFNDSMQHAQQASIDAANDLAAAATVDAMMASDDGSISMDAS